MCGLNDHYHYIKHYTEIKAISKTYSLLVLQVGRQTNEVQQGLHLGAWQICYGLFFRSGVKWSTHCWLRSFRWGVCGNADLCWFRCSPSSPAGHRVRKRRFGFINVNQHSTNQMWFSLISLQVYVIISVCSSSKALSNTAIFLSVTEDNTLHVYRSFVVLVYVCVCTDQVLDDLLYLGLSLLHLLRRPFETDALLAIGKLYVNLHTQTGIKASQLGSFPLLLHPVLILPCCNSSQLMSSFPNQVSSAVTFLCLCFVQHFLLYWSLLHNNCCRNTASSPQSILSRCRSRMWDFCVISGFYLRSPHAFFVLLSLPVVAAVWSARCSVLSCQWWSGAARRGQSPPPPSRS